MSEKSAWRTQLLAELGGLLAPYGFKFVAATRSYQRETETGWQSIHLSLVQHPDDFDVVVDADIRFDAVEREIQGDTDKRGRAATIGCEYGNWIGTGQHRWAIASAADVPSAARDIVRACKTVLFPFFERFSDLATVADALRKEDKQAWLLMPLESKRHAIVAAADALLHRSPRS